MSPSPIDFFAAELAPDDEVDLHGLSALEARHELQHALERAWRHRARSIRIIHGHGTGQIRIMTERYLRSETRLVKAFQVSQQPHELGAVTYALLHDTPLGQRRRTMRN